MISDSELPSDHGLISDYGLTYEYGWISVHELIRFFVSYFIFPSMVKILKNRVYFHRRMVSYNDLWNYDIFSSSEYQPRLEHGSLLQPIEWIYNYGTFFTPCAKYHTIYWWVFWSAHAGQSSKHSNESIYVRKNETQKKLSPKSLNLVEINSIFR